MGLFKKRIARLLKDRERERYEGGRLRSFCEFCGVDIKSSQSNVCRLCRKSYCKKHLNTVGHNCKKRHLAPFRTWSGKGKYKSRYN